MTHSISIFATILVAAALVSCEGGEDRTVESVPSPVSCSPSGRSGFHSCTSPRSRARTSTSYCASDPEKPLFPLRQQRLHPRSQPHDPMAVVRRWRSE